MVTEDIICKAIKAKRKFKKRQLSEIIKHLIDLYGVDEKIEDNILHNSVRSYDLEDSLLESPINNRGKYIIHNIKYCKNSDCYSNDLFVLYSNDNYRNVLENFSFFEVEELIEIINIILKKEINNKK